MQRFFLPDMTGTVESTLDLTSIHHQLTRVLRAKPGDCIMVLDNRGSARLVEISDVTRRTAAGRVLAVEDAPPPPAVKLTLYQCAIKADKLEWVWQKGTELGVSAFVPVVSLRTVQRKAAALDRKQERWESIIREAAEQSGRGELPVLGDVCPFENAIQHTAEHRLLLWEEADAQPGVIAALSRIDLPVRELSVFIGPEGGLTPEEVAAAEAAGWQVVGMGRRILRAETAALAAVSLVMGALGEIGEPAPSPASHSAHASPEPPAYRAGVT